MTAVVVSHLESVFTGNIDPFAKAAAIVETTQKRIDGKKTTAKVDADTTKAKTKLDEVDTATKKITAAETVAKVDADIAKATKKVGSITADLDVLHHLDTTPEVTADIAKAEKSLAKAQSALSALNGARAKMSVEADTSKAEGELGGLSDKAADAGSDGGARAGKNLGAGILAAIATIPIAGAVVGIGKAISDSLLEGLDADATGDLFGARTGLDEATTARLGRAAGEAYAENFGESTAANLDTARRAIDAGLLDPKATARDAEAVISSLSGVSDILEEDIPRVARSAAQILKTGLAKDAAGAFDLIVKGQQAGLNVSEDLLDTFDEYGTQFRVLGLEGPQALGLLNQAVKAGARDTDIAADALKEYAIRAVDDSELTATSFEAAGLSAREMADDIAAGGPRAARALERTLDAVREIEDPIKRNAAAVGLFGTQAEDMGDALFAMDLSNAVKELGAVEGAADRALTRLGDNAKDDLAGATRDIDLAATQIKTSLAVAFGDDISNFAETVSNNREKVVSFLFDAADAAIGFSTALVDGAAAGTEALGDFGGSLGPLITGMAEMATAVDQAMPGDQESKAFREWAAGAVDNLAEFDKSTEKTADQIREQLIENGLDPAQAKLDELRIPAEAAARLSDTSGKLAGDIEGVGYAADGSKLALDLMNGKVNTSTKAGAQLDRQIKGVKGSLEDQVRAAAAAGESQASLRDRVNLARGAFIAQMEALGLTSGQAKRLADQYGLIPKKVVTEVTDNGSAARVKQNIDNIPSSKTVTITTIQQVLGKVPTGTGTVLRRSVGGPIIGPGTGTSDDVLIAASTGEHMVTAEEVQKAGGHGAMYRLRAQIRAGLAKFRGGGAIGQAEDELQRAQRMSLSSRRAVTEARRDERRARLESTKREAERRTERYEQLHEERQRAVDAARDKVARLREQGSEVGTDLRRGNIRDSVTGGLSGALGVTDQLRELADSGDVSRFRRRRLDSVAGAAEKALTGLYKQADKVDAKISSATDNLQKWKSIADGVSSSISGGFSLGDVSGGVNPWSGEEKQATGKQLLTASEEYRTKARNLVLKLRELQKAGYGTGILQEVAGQGVDSGVAMADALLQLSPKDATALRKAQADIDFYAGRAGIAATDDKVTSAARDLEAAEAQADALDRCIDSWAKKLGKELAAALGIKARAGGGPVMAGHAYLVNEDTPNSELFIPDQSGYVLNNRQMGGRGAGGPSVTHNWNITNIHPVNEAASVTAAKAARTLANTGRR